VPALVACKALKKLTLSGSAVTTKGMAELKEKLPGCEVIHATAKAPAPTKIDSKMLLGKWERQGTPKSVFVWEFGADGKYTIANTTAGTTNTPGAYTLEGDRLTCDGGKIKETGTLVYTIVKLTADELELRTSTGSEITFKKVKAKK
jgi:uncharacterized protein (TIGR03066 family)